MDHLTACGRGDASDSIRLDARERLWPVLAELGRLADAASILDALLAERRARPGSDTASLLSARAHVAARQGGGATRLVARAGGEVRITKNRFGMSMVPVTIGTHADTLLLDTGAGMSVLSQSLADSMGVVPLGGTVNVVGVTGVRAVARIALVTVVFGGATVEAVPHIVLPDSALAVQAGPLRLQVRGVVGLPVLLAIEEFSLSADGLLSVPKVPRLSGAPNLAMDGTRLIAEVTHDGRASVMGVDTGARTTSLYPLARSLIGADTVLGRAGTMQVGGAGGTRSYEIVRIPELRLGIGGTTATLREVALMREPPTDRARYLAGNVGQDVLGAFGVATFNLRSMILRLGPNPTAPDGLRK